MQVTHSPQRDRAWGRFFAGRGAREVIASCQAPTPTERLVAWLAKYHSLPIEMRLPKSR